MSTLPLSKVIDLDDFAAPELEPYLGEVGGPDAGRFGASPDDAMADSALWQSAMALRALDNAGAASTGSMVAGIGAGIGSAVFALARRDALVFAADRYLHRSLRSDTAPAGMLIDPAQYTTVEFPRGHVLPINSHAMRLNLPSDTFDAVFSLGTMEGLGTLENIAAAAREIGRVLKPGGVASIATEFRLDGPDDRRWFDDRIILFTPQMLERWIVKASGLTMRDPLVTAQSDRTFETRQHFADFLKRAEPVHGLAEKRAVSPNLVLYHDGFLFCPVVLTLYKDQGWSAPIDSSEEQRIAAQVRSENAALAALLERFQRTAETGEQPAENHLLFGEVERLRADNDALRAAYDRSNAWKKWPVMRPARFVYRRFKRWRG